MIHTQIIKLSFIIFLIEAITSYGCSTSNLRHSHNAESFKVVEIDSTTFEDYIFVFLKDYYGLDKILLSTRLKHYESINKYFTYFDTMKTNGEYDITLHPIDTSLVFRTKSSPHGINVYEMNGLIVWSYDTLRTKVYLSNQVKDIFIEKMH